MNGQIEILPFTKAEKDAFKTLNYEWLEKYFSIEPVDIDLLNNPKKYILDKGGYVFYAFRKEEIVGAFALLKMEEAVFELSKMAVSEKMRGKGIGNKMLKFCLDFAKEQQFKAIVLYSARKLKSAIHLYEKYGFKEVAFEPGDYKRTDIKMELWF